MMQKRLLSIPCTDPRDILRTADDDDDDDDDDNDNDDAAVTVS